MCSTCFIGLQKHLETTSVRHLQNLVCFLKESLMTRLSAIKSDPIFIIATVVDPEFKLSWTSSVSEINNANTWQIWLAMLDAPVVAQSEGDTESVPPSKRKKLFSFIDKSHITNETRTAYQDYLAAVHSEEEIKKGSLVYWKNNSIAYPLLSCLAKKYLSVPATSAPVERAFHTAGNILRQQRCRLLPKNFETLLFLKLNSCIM